MIGNKLEPFKFWCQKVLPNVYDDSLSYYEYLCKLNEYLNDVIEQINTLTDNMSDYEEDLTTQWGEYKTGLNTEWTDYKAQLNEQWAYYKNYIDHYFDNLDVQTEINNKLDQMALNGSLSALIEPFVGTDIQNTVNAWLTAHVDPVGSAVIVDNTLTISGAAADAKEAGKRIDINAEAIKTTTSPNGTASGNAIVSKFVNGSWERGNSDTPITTDAQNRVRPYSFIKVYAGQKIIITNGSYYHAVGIWTGDIGSAVAVRNDNTLVTTDETILIANNGIFICTFADASDQTTNIDPSDFNGSVQITNNISYLKDNVLASLNKNLIGMEVGTQYPVNLKSGINITFSTKNGSPISESLIYLQFFDANREYITYYQMDGFATRTMLVSSNTAFLSWSKYPGVDCMVEIGRTATTYVDYVPNTKLLNEHLQLNDSYTLNGNSIISPTVNGSFASNGLTSGNQKRLRTDLIPVQAGRKLIIKNGSFKHAVGIWKYSVTAPNNIRNDGSWQTVDETILFDYDGYCIVAFAKTDDTQTITASEFNGSVTNYSYLNYEDIPEYWKSSLNTKIASLQSNSAKSAIGDSFVFITDYHMKNNENNSPSLIKSIMNNTGVRFIMQGGDIITQESTQASALERLATFNKMFDGMPIFNVIGNHDQNNPGDQDQPYQLTNAQSYSMLCKKEEGWYLGTDDFDYYFDNKAQKIRYFVIGSWHQSWIVTSQVKWFCNELLNVPDGYNIFVFSHLGLTSTGVNGNFQYILNAMEAYQSRDNAYHYSTKVYDYSNATANIIGAITGHAHRDLSYQSSSGFPVIGTTTDSIGEEHPGTSMTAGTDTEQAFDVVQIDLTDKKIYCVRIGAGSDRTFSYTT